MQTQQLNRITGSVAANPRSQKPLSFLQLAGAQTKRRAIRISFAPRREVCLTKRAMLAALREAEFDEWLASGGDFLDRMHQPVH